MEYLSYVVPVDVYELRQHMLRLLCIVAKQLILTCIPRAFNVSCYCLAACTVYFIQSPIVECLLAVAVTCDQYLCETYIVLKCTMDTGETILWT